MKEDTLSNRKFFFYFVIVAIFFLFCIRLFQLQILDESYKLSADNNVLRITTIYPERGYIFDRNEKLIVANKLAFDLMILPKELEDLDTVEFCKDLNISIEEFFLYDKKMKNEKNYSYHKPNIFIIDIKL